MCTGTEHELPILLIYEGYGREGNGERMREVLRVSDLVRYLPRLAKERGWTMDVIAPDAPGSRLRLESGDTQANNFWHSTTGNTRMEGMSVQVMAGMNEWQTARTMLHETVHTYIDADAMWFMPWLNAHGIEIPGKGTRFDASTMPSGYAERLRRDKRTESASEVMCESTVQLVLRSLDMWHGPMVDYSDKYLKNWITGYVYDLGHGVNPAYNNKVDTDRIEQTAREIVTRLREMKQQDGGKY